MSGQICLKALNSDTDPSDPPFNDNNNNSPLPADNAVQAIITTYKFYCDCVNITSWETYVQPGGGRYSSIMAYDITFQVWRPSPTVNDSGCYSLVGENVFTSFSFNDGGLVQLSPPNSSIITAQSGDVVGYYTKSREGMNDGIQLERDSIYTENIIWYQAIDSNGLTPLLDSDCPYPVGSESGRILASSTNAAPMLRLVTSKKILIYLLIFFFFSFSIVCLFVCFHGRHIFMCHFDSPYFCVLDSSFFLQNICLFIFMAATFPCNILTPLPSQSSIPSLHSEIQVSSTVPAQVPSVDTTTNLASSSFLHSSVDVLSSELPSSMSVLVPSGPTRSGNGTHISHISILPFLFYGPVQ